MPNIRLDFTGDLTQLNTQILGVIQRIDSLNRSASTVYAQRGDMGMIGLQRQIAAAKTELDGLLSSFAQISGANTTGALTTQFQALTREINRAVAASLGLKAGTATSQDFILNDAVRQQTALAALQADKKRYYDQDIANQAAQAAAQRKATQDALANLKSYQKEQDRARQEQEAFAQKLAPSQPIGTQREELKRQFDAATQAGERLKKVQDDLIAKYNQIRAAGQRTFAEIGRDMEATPHSFIGGETTKVKYDPGAQKYVEDYKKVGEAGSAAFEKVGFAMRHSVAIFDESMRGQRGAMISSISAMVRDLGVLDLAFKNLASPWALVAAAGVGALAAIVIAAERAHARLIDVRDAASALALAGAGKPGGTTYESQAAAQFAKDKAASDEYQSSQIKIDEQLNKLTGTARHARQEIEDMGKALKGLNWGDVAKETEEVVKEANKGAEAYAKWAEIKFSLQGFREGGKTIEEVAKAAEDLGGNGVKAVNDFVNAARPGILATGAAANKAQNDLYGNTLALGELGAAGVVTGPVIDQLANDTQQAIDPTKNLTAAVIEETAAEIANGQAVARLTQNLDAYSQAARDAQSATDALTNARLNSRRDDPDPNLGRDIEAQRNAIANEARVPLGSADDQEHQKRMEQINAEAQARHADLQAQAEAATKRREEAERVARLRPGQSTDTPDVLKSKEDEKEAWRKVEDQKVQIEIESQRAIIQNEMLGTAARIKAQQEIIRLTQQEADAGRKTAVDVAQEKIKLETLIRQERLKTFQEARDNARAEVELAKGNVAEIIAAYDKLSAAARTAGMPPAVDAQIQREKVRDLESAQQKAFSAETEFNSARERLGELQIATEKARLATEVAAHKMSKDDMFRAESEFTQKVMADNEARIQNEIANDDITDEQKSKLYAHLAELYQKDAELQIQNQEKATQAIEAENKKREALFTKMFDSIGSEGEKAIEGLFDRSKTHHQVEAQFLGSVLKTVGTSAASELSDIGGEKLGPMLGLKPEESKGGIGQVLGSSLFKALGLEKDVPTDKMGSAADKMKSAMDASLKASELTKDAAKDLHEAAQAIKGAAQQRGVTSPYGTGTGDGTGAGGVPAAGTTLGHNAGVALSGTFAEMEAKFQANLKAALAEANAALGTHYAAGKEYRSMAEQRDIYATSAPGMAASPGGSMHGLGLANDLRIEGGGKISDADWQKLQPFMAQHDIMRGDQVPGRGMPTEAWHVEPVGGYQAVQAAGGARKILESGAGGPQAASTSAPVPVTIVDGTGGRTTPLDEGGKTYPPGVMSPSELDAYHKRPGGDRAGGGQQSSVTLDPSSSQVVATGVLTGTQQAATTTQTAIEQGTQQGNAAVVQADNADKAALDATKVSLDKNVSALDKNTNKLGSASPSGGGGGGGGSDGSTSGASTALNTFKDTVGTAGSALTSLGGRFGQIGNAINRGVGTITQISSGITKASSDFDLLSGTTKAASTAQTLAQSATTLNATAVATDTTAMQTNAAAAASSGGGGILGGIFKIFGFAGGGIVPSAAGGFVMPSQGLAGGGQLSILHPQEMVLPAGISSGLQGMIGRGGAGFGGGGISRDVGEQPSMSVNYTANVTGYHPFNSATEFETMLRSNSSSLFSYFRNIARNNNYSGFSGIG